MSGHVLLHPTKKKIFFFYLSFLSRTSTNRRTAGEGRGHFFNSSLPLPPASQTLRHQPGDYCRELTSAHSQQPDLNREPLVSERKSLTTKLRALKSISSLHQCLTLYKKSTQLFSRNNDNLFYRTLGMHGHGLQHPPKMIG